MDSRTIRQKFFDFFQQKNHTIVPSSSLIPAQDPTLLFANAGMNQFKDVFLGKETRSYVRAASIQKCMRAGGKHNDLDNVGFTKRHLTFFEMMGNFSFGDYFKKEAIAYAWEFLTASLALDKQKLYASVFMHDDEAYDIWHTQIGLPAERIVRLGAADNFWQMGDTGPCGPCSEIYIDRGPEKGCGKKECAPGCSCDRFLEIWNLVFMQFDRQPDGTDKPLKQVGVDTGMGLERLCSVVQNTDSVFQTDLFMPLIEQVQKLTGIDYKTADANKKAAFHVLADHIRAATFLIADGCAPSNDGRGYVLRKIIRRAALFNKKLTDKPLFADIAPTVIDMMGNMYPELRTQQGVIVKVIRHEVERFATNLVHGQQLLLDYMGHAQDTIISGQEAFKLYDTYGFPLELTQLIAQEHHFTVDVEGFWKYMHKQQEQSGKKVITGQAPILPDTITTEFTGYQETRTDSSIIALVYNNHVSNHVAAGDECWIIPEKSPFYVECGGQVSDTGFITLKGKQMPLTGLQKMGKAIALKVQVTEPVAVGDSLVQEVDAHARAATMKNHTATHLLQAALMQLLGKQVKQAGSLVAPDYLRFDFTYHENLTTDQIATIEQMVNEKIQENIPLSVKTTSYKAALDQGVIAFFGEKYNPENVRVVSVPGFSAELCGGTHVRATGDIGCFKITEITALSAGQRRIVALTGPKAVELFQHSFATVKALAQEFKAKPDQVLGAYEKQKEQLREAQTSIKQLKKEVQSLQLPRLLQKVHQLHTMPYGYFELHDYSPQDLKELAQQLLAQKPGLYILVSSDAQRSSLFATVSGEYVSKINMKQFSEWLVSTYGIRSGIKDATLQGGGPVISRTFGQEVQAWLQENVK